MAREQKAAPVGAALTPTGRVVSTRSGPGIIIICLYGLFALAAGGRASVQIAEQFDKAPLAYSLSALAAVVYLIATICLAIGTPATVAAARVSCLVELVGVLGTGIASYAVPSLFPDKTIWSHFGQGYGYIPLVLPVLGLWWIHRTRTAFSDVGTGSAAK